MHRRLIHLGAVAAFTQSGGRQLCAFWESVEKAIWNKIGAIESLEELICKKYAIVNAYGGYHEV